MKLILDIAGADDVTFGPEDEIRGTINLLGHAGHVLSHPRVTFGGRLTISMPAQIAGPNPSDLEFTLFEENKELRHNDATSNKDRPVNGIYIVPFSFRFPSQVRCFAHTHSLHLPPSMDIREAESRIKVEYYVRGAVDRQILGPLSKTTRVVKGLKFSNNVPINISPVLLPSTSLPLVLRQKDGSRYLEDGIDGLPAYAPSLRVEALLPEPPVLFRGQANPIKFILHTPSEIVGKIFVRTANIFFKTSTTTIVGSVTRRVDEHCPGSSMSGVIPVDSESLVFDSSAWGRLFKLDLKPTFESCVMRIKHSAEIRVGISIGPEGKIYYTSSWLDVQVMDPPPAYENAE
ncbi:uncharacterized protein TRIVIDRAFT_228258 [Trichoderma virens Gv29-8]|uniref:Arrestin-like N-terminal domain-containing protein n=1 Tax=Hypocrea virens (strain Gv29-8 / FGSC 10586) TaxID=413071 RepID=G9NBZ1_HYPVG|nr:uncharacterized protein TRIVIDRAFT_228258 [Trichoderma virens Gv29-8]EHK15216.1 hypothetical protein TRIVIDRAFT_228258 [Trichoderma virens Gv29-8]